MTGFPRDFVWGAATSSYQIEGAAQEGGRSPSIWDAFTRRPDAVERRHHGDVACDHYHRFREDVGLFREIGLQAYRFSVAWPRVLPDGTGAVSQAGLDFYSRLVDALLEAGIRPMATLFHWDLPLVLHRRGGWQDRASAEWFAEYAALMARTLGDRVQDWMTINEPQVLINKGYVEGSFAPGERQDRAASLHASHNLLRAHGRAVQAIRAESKPGTRVGWAPVCITHAPFDPSSPADVEAARRTMFEPDLGKGEWSLWNNSWWMDPVMTGAYPDVFDSLGADAPQIVDGDMGLIHQPLDFVGINIYHCERIRATPSGGAEVVPLRPGEGMTLMGWDITPEALYWGPKFLHEKYGTPMFITENGMACHDWVSVDGEVHDPSRIDFITRYLTQLRQAVSEGLPVQGYLYWSALDNFEWERGYAQRFGLIHVDFETQVRTLKDSAKWYRELIRTGGETLPSEPSRL